MKVARIYMRVSTEEQDLSRQDAVLEQARSAGFYIASIYIERRPLARGRTDQSCSE